VTISSIEPTKATDSQLRYAQLVVRTSRRLLLTEAGTAYVASARRVLEELTEVERAASGEYRAPRGELLATAPIMFGTLSVAPIVHHFFAAYPGVSVRLVLSDWVIDLVESHIDIAVRIGHLPDSGWRWPAGHSRPGKQQGGSQDRWPRNPYDLTMPTPTNALWASGAASSGMCFWIGYRRHRGSDGPTLAVEMVRSRN
jgi:DNA-binding transcriptional LysR family regulator